HPCDVYVSGNLTLLNDHTVTLIDDGSTPEGSGLVFFGDQDNMLGGSGEILFDGQAFTHSHVGFDGGGALDIGSGIRIRTAATGGSIACTENRGVISAQ